MEIEYKSNWIRPTVELMKCLDTISDPEINEELGSIDYLIKDDDEKRLIRTLVNDDYTAAPAYVDAIRATIQEIDEEKYDEITILSERITNSSHDLVAKIDKLNVITPNTKHTFSLVEVLSAIQKKTIDLCITKCGKAPEIKADCKGKKGRVYTCDVRRISDDATFHASMKWKKVLIEDFNHLCELEKEIQTRMEVQ
jgi:hypothetical protein